MRIKSLFLSGPDLWAPDALDLIARKRSACHAAGYEPVTGRDGDRMEIDASEASAREIYAGALANLRRCDAVIANLTPWRGLACDSGTAFEAGFASALSKPVFAYINVADEDEADYRERVELRLGAAPDETGVWRDPDGCEIEDFGLPENLMLWAEARRFYIIVTPDPLSDITGLELCLEALSEYSD